MFKRSIISTGLRALIAILPAMQLTACAHSPTADADRAQIADVASTGIGVANGLQEANPIVSPLVENGAAGLLGLTALKLGINRIAPSQDYQNCRTLLSVTTATGWGAAVNNIALLVAPPLALVSIPVAIQAYDSAWDGSARDTCTEAVAARKREQAIETPVAEDPTTTPGPVATPETAPEQELEARLPPA